jgi:pimeloyl-ACP methyl ester carboxylesterase
VQCIYDSVMGHAPVNDIDIYYETFGGEAGPPLLLVCGLGMQLTSWSAEWFEALATEGWRVIAYDNRDVGLSTHLADAGTPDFAQLLSGGDLNVAYLLSDMAADAAGLLDHLGIEAAHVVGISMGGMIAQQLAIDHPSRVLSLCSIMSSTGSPFVGQPTPEAAASLLGAAPASRKEAEDLAVAMWGVFGSPGYPFDEERERRLAGEAYDRAHDPDGFARHAAALLASPDRTEQLGTVTVPTVVIHGLADTLVTPSGGEATAAAIQGARLVSIEGMGHSLPFGVWPTVISAIDENIRAAAGGAATVPA